MTLRCDMICLLCGSKAGSGYFEVSFGRCARTICWLKAFIDCKCLVIYLVYDGKRVVKRLISISAEVLKSVAKIESSKLILRDCKAICKRINNDTTHCHSNDSKDIFHPLRSSSVNQIRIFRI